MPIALLGCFASLLPSNWSARRLCGEEKTLLAECAPSRRRGQTAETDDTPHREIPVAACVALANDSIRSHSRQAKEVAFYGDLADDPRRRICDCVCVK